MIARRTFLGSLLLAAIRAQAAPGIGFFGNSKVKIQLLNGLLGYWKLDEAAGCTNNTVCYADATGNGWSGTFFGTSSQTTTGLIEALAYKDPFIAPRNISVSKNIDTRAASAPYSFQAWIKSPLDRSGNSIAAFDWNCATPGWRIEYSGIAHVLFDSDNSSGSTDTITGTAVLTANTWQQVVATWDGTTKRLYTNGVADGTSTPSDIRRGATALVFDNDCGGAQQPDTNLCELGYWNRSISAAEVNALWNGGLGKAFSTFTN